MSNHGFKADHFALVRFPVLASKTLEDLAALTGERLEEKVREYLRDPYVREAIYLASPALYRKIDGWESGESAFNDLAQAVSRYLLRMAYRATPFGTFSAVAVCEIGGREMRMRLPQRSELHRLAQLDGSALSRLALQCAGDPLVRDALNYTPNDTLFANGDAYVYTAYERNKRGRRVYRRVEIERSPHVETALASAHDGRTVAEIVSSLMREFPDESSREEAEAFVWELVDAQVLCCDALVDITEADGLRPLRDALPETSDLRRAIVEIACELEAISGVGPLTTTDGYASINAKLAALKVRADRELPTKVDLYTAPDLRLQLPSTVIDDVQRAVNRLVTIVRKKNKLADFVKNFVERYGDSEVPLGIVGDQLEALGFSDRDATLPALSRMVRIDKSSRPSTGSLPLLDRLLAFAVGRMGERYVDIAPLMDASDDAAQSLQEDATLVVWFALWSPDDIGEHPIIEIRSAGLQDPGRLMGRFAHGIPAIADYLRESNRNAPAPVVEIVHQPEDRLGNISARPRLSDYEIRLRGGTPKSAQRLPLDDLTVSVVRDRVVVRSKMLAMPLELRMSNAHAYDRQGNLPLYRFLNHVSNQDYAADLFSLRRRMPQAEYVPGVRYGDIIVSKPSWLISARDVARLKKIPRASLHAEFGAFRRARNIPEWVALVQADNVIPYRLDNAWMIDDLLKAAFKSGEALLTEVSPQDRQPALSSPTGRHFHEVQIVLRAQARSTSLLAPVSVPPELAVVPLWSDWAYFKLYAPPHLQNTVLVEVRDAIVRMRATSSIDGVFFVRYRDEQGAHLRLRFASADGHAAERSISGLRTVFDRLYAQCTIHNVCMAPYVRETSRYGGDARTAICEKIFIVDSACVLEALPLIDSDHIAAWRDAASAIDCMLLSFGIDRIEHRFAFARRAAADFDAEMRFSSDERKRIGTIYSASKPLPVAESTAPARQDIPSAAVFAAAIAPIAELWRAWCSVPEALADDKVYSVQWSLIHMRLNRLFDRDARLQESVVWELLKRSYAAALKRGVSSKTE
jgi:lantibiotic biosynthesis protein